MVLGVSTAPEEAVVTPTTILLATGVAPDPAPDATTSQPYPTGVPDAGAVQLKEAEVDVILDTVSPVGGKHVGSVLITNWSMP